MKPVRLRPRARQDRHDEVRYYRDTAGANVAIKLVKALQRALDAIAENPRLGSPVLGRDIEIDGLRTWMVEGFPLTFWYFERDETIDVARLVGQRQDALSIDPDTTGPPGP